AGSRAGRRSRLVMRQGPALGGGVRLELRCQGGQPAKVFLGTRRAPVLKGTVWTVILRVVPHLLRRHPEDRPVGHVPLALAVDNDLVVGRGSGRALGCEGVVLLRERECEGPG